MGSDLSFIHLVANASPLVQLVMASLILASVISWTMIFDRAKVLKSARKAADKFEQRFWSGGDLGELFRNVDRENDEATGMASIFHAGFREFARLKKNPDVEPMAVVEGARRSMHVALSREMDGLENHLAFLATVGSTSPYLGLFGTVWGIMNAFVALGNVKQATLSLVAPGIAEALIATAMGLFAAIPAVVAYNRYSNDVECLSGRYEDFLNEFTTILQRQAHMQ
ncbi:protein TolQ [Solemya velesiana gill symbiont]|uniref:Tol-Pal system protein TolQ n=1 Tax=Solemya velesiana gill symbiont TaxID=1918948 RepID=A0A1T2KTD9_9GAMM|nr:protein TolQ [Solemya velesiana gill symbiont]OOZ36115.1 protein TolQ [Solemya velesiana gill symbiont]